MVRVQGEKKRLTPTKVNSPLHIQDMKNITHDGIESKKKYYEMYQSFLDAGIYTVPIDIKTKRCIHEAWNLPETSFGLDDFQDSGIGLITGPISKGIMALDIDNEARDIQEQITASLPPVFSGRMGNKARLPARFYQVSDELKGFFESGQLKKNFIHIGVELKFNTLLVLPPSIHPRGYSYEWVGTPLIDEVGRVLDTDKLPVFGMVEYKYFHELNEVFKREKISPKDHSGLEKPGVRGESMTGSYPEISRVMTGLIIHGHSYEEVVKKILDYDRKINVDQGQASFFNCMRHDKTFKGRHGKDACEWFVSECFKRNKMSIVVKPVDTTGAYLRDCIPTEYMKVEKGSFLYRIEKAIARNQYVTNEKMSFVTALSICSWICSLNVRFMGIAPNLMILMIAPSGAGKSTSSKAITALIKEVPILQKSYRGGDIRTDSSLYMAIEEAPVSLFLIDEFTKIVKGMNNPNSQTAALPEILCALYSDYTANSTPHMVRIKNETYGVCVDPKMNLLGFSTTRFWDTFSLDNYTQGLGRRLFIVEDPVVREHVVGKEMEAQFFRNEEIMAFRSFITKVLLTGKELFDEEDISQYELLKDKKVVKGVEVKNYWKRCKKAKKNIILTASDEAKKYFSDDLPLLLNKLKKEIASKGSEIDLFLVSSMAEYIPKFAAIHALCGKNMINKEDSLKAGDFCFNFNTVVQMDSVKWAENIYLYYMVGSLSERLGSAFGQDEKTETENVVVKDLIKHLQGRNVKSFRKSDPEVRNFFRRRGGTRDIVILKAVALGLLKCDGDINRRGTEFTINT